MNVCVGGGCGGGVWVWGGEGGGGGGSGGGGQCIWTEGAGVHSSPPPSLQCVPDEQAQF